MMFGMFTLILYELMGKIELFSDLKFLSIINFNVTINYNLNHLLIEFFYYAKEMLMWRCFFVLNLLCPYFENIFEKKTAGITPVMRVEHQFHWQFKFYIQLAWETESTHAVHYAV